jgi:hypothetical protein
MMSIRKVKKLKVGAVHYTVERRPVPITELDNGNVVGRTHYDAGKLLISDALCEETESLTILHEALHALFWHAGMREQDERLIEALSGLLLDFIRDNPAYIKAVQSQQH